MILAGIELKRPTFWALTRAVGFGAVLWIILTLSPIGSTSPVVAGAHLVAIIFGCLCSTVGIDVTQGGRHLVLNIAGCCLAVVLYLAAVAIFI